MNLWIVLLSAAAVMQAAPPHAENLVYRELRAGGVTLGGTQTVPLPEPAMPDGLDAPAQQAVLAKVAGTAYPLARLLRNSPVAPHLLQQRELDGPEGRGRAVDVYFVLYGQLDTLDDRETLDRVWKSEDDQDVASSGGSLEAGELAARNISWNAAHADFEAFSAGAASLWKRVEVASVTHSLWTRSPESLLAAAQTDHRFDDDAEHPNRWWPLELTPQGTLQRGQPQVYPGVGMYLKVTRLHEPAGALFCEGHLVFAEPLGWFDGNNLLGSKLPAIVQSRVRALRREVALAEQQR
ncbi:MAG: hypothetical protein K1X74_08045 [Pirellulales bacterium]|nr:hypothetical protein [Pirellulales bacterium]